MLTNDWLILIYMLVFVCIGLDVEAIRRNQREIHKTLRNIEDILKSK